MQGSGQPFDGRWQRRFLQDVQGANSETGHTTEPVFFVPWRGIREYSLAYPNREISKLVSGCRSTGGKPALRGGAGDRPDTTQGDSELGVGCGCRGKAQGKEFYTQGDCISNLCRHGPAEGEPGGKKAHRAEQKKPPHGRLLEVLLISPDRSVFRNYSPISFQLTKIRLRVQSL